MTELAFELSPSDELFAVKPETETLPRLDARRGVFITSWNEEIELSDRPVNGLVVQRLQQEGKPKIPMVEVLLMGKHKQLEPHVGHEGYQARLLEWQEESNAAIMRYLFVVGVKGSPPPEFIAEQADFFPDATAQDMKYLWVASRIPNGDMGAFTEAVMGRGSPTLKAVEQVSNFTESA